MTRHSFISLELYYRIISLLDFLFPPHIIENETTDNLTTNPLVNNNKHLVSALQCNLLLISLLPQSCL